MNALPRTVIRKKRTSISQYSVHVNYILCISSCVIGTPVDTMCMCKSTLQKWKGVKISLSKRCSSTSILSILCMNCRPNVVCLFYYIILCIVCVLCNVGYTCSCAPSYTTFYGLYIFTLF